MSATIDLTGIATTAMEGIFSIAAIVIPLMIQSHLKDTAAATALGNAVKNSLGAMQQAGTSAVTAWSPHLSIPGVTPQMAVGIQYVLDNAGTEAARFDVTPEKIAQKIDAQLGLANIATNLATAASPAPSPKPLDPVVSPVAA